MNDAKSTKNTENHARKIRKAGKKEGEKPKPEPELKSELESESESESESEIQLNSLNAQRKVKDEQKATPQSINRKVQEDAASKSEKENEICIYRDENDEEDTNRQMDSDISIEDKKTKTSSVMSALSRVEKLSPNGIFTEDSIPQSHMKDESSSTARQKTAGAAFVSTLFMQTGVGASGVQSDGINELFLTELANLNLPSLNPEEAPPLPPAGNIRASLMSQTIPLATLSPDDTGHRYVRSWYEFSHVRPLHMCAAHSFVCFRDNGDLVAVTPTCVCIYDRPPAACELTYKEPLYSIPVSDVFRVADLNDNSILLMRQGGFQITEKRASDELLVAEVGTNAISLLAKIALPQTVLSMTHTLSWSYPVLRERSSQRHSAECRGMQVNKKEHKVYLLYDYHLAVIDLDMRLEPVILRLRCNVDRQPLLEQTGPAVALMEFDHAVYILTSRLCVLGTNKTSLFAQDPSSCCMPILQTLMDWRLQAANEICSYVVDRRHCTAFFSVPKGRKLISLRFSVPAILNSSLDFEPASAPLLQTILIQDRLYSDANNKDWAAAVPWSLAWDSTTQQLLVLEWGSENNGILISLDVCLQEGILSRKMEPWTNKDAAPIYDRFLIVKTFSLSNNCV